MSLEGVFMLPPVATVGDGNLCKDDTSIMLSSELSMKTVAALAKLGSVSKSSLIPGLKDIAKLGKVLAQKW